MEDGELSEGEIISSHEKEDDEDEISPAIKTIGPGDGQNQPLVPAVKHTHQATGATNGSQNQKKRNRKKQKRSRSNMNAAFDCERGNGDDSSDPPPKKARSEVDGKDDAALSVEGQRAADIPKVAAIRQQNLGPKGKKSKKGCKRNSSSDTTSYATVPMLLDRLRQSPSDSKVTFLMKTVDFSLAVRQLVAGVPNGPQHTNGHAAGTSKRVVVVWLSQVSAKMFSASEDLFKRLKAFTGFTFDIENPGSAYFSKMGLEAFMALPEDEEAGEEEEEPVGPFTKADCMLSEVELVSNEFPSAHTPPQEYVTLSQGEVAVGGASDVPSMVSHDEQGKILCDIVKESCDAMKESCDPTKESCDAMKEPHSQHEVGQCDILESCGAACNIVPEVSHDMAEVSHDDVPPATPHHLACSNYPMFAVDCEMVSTPHGLELARVSVVDEALQCRYDSLVRPQSTILDYLTKYSGITEETLRDVTTTLADVQQSLVKLLPQKCILVGHSLENDFRALKLSHPHVIDTSCLFTPTAPTLYKPGLRLLAKQLLLEDIQHGNGGHSSVEDAVTCMKLVQKKLREGRSCVVPWPNKKKNLISELVDKKKRVGIVDKSSVVNLFGQAATEKACVADDSDAVKEALQMVAKVDLAFVQLHAVEQCLKTSCEAATLSKVLDCVDEQAARIASECATANSMVLVVCGSSCINEVKKIQAGCQRGKGAKQERIKEEIAIARHGLVKVCMV